MSKNERKVADEGKALVWVNPSIKYVGNVSEIVQFPGGGKLSLVADDMGDEQRKPKGSE